MYAIRSYYDDVIKVNLDIATKIGLRKRSNVTSSQLFEALSSHRPNDYPLFVSQLPDIDSLGWSPINGQTNLYGDLSRTGYVNNEDFNAKTALGFNFDFSKYIKGLSASTNIGFDSYNS